MVERNGAGGNCEPLHILIVLPHNSSRQSHHNQPLHPYQSTNSTSSVRPAHLAHPTLFLGHVLCELKSLNVDQLSPLTLAYESA